MTQVNAGSLQRAAASFPAKVDTTGRSYVMSAPVELPNSSGLHARPASALASMAKKFRSDIRLVRANHEANAKSVVGIIGLGAERGDFLQVKASGEDADAAVAALSALLSAGCDDDELAAPAPAQAPVVQAAPKPPVVALATNELGGVPASPGVAMGTVVQIRHHQIEVSESGAGVDAEQTRLYRALEQAWTDLETAKAGFTDKARLQIMSAHQELLMDPDLLDCANTRVLQGKSAAFAWRAAFTEQAAMVATLSNELLRERAHDIQDVGQRVLGILTGTRRQAIDVPPGSILIAEELTPSDTASLNREHVLGFCTATGGATSHVAILARSLDLPAICGIDTAALSVRQGCPVILDGTRGVLHTNPSAQEVEQARQRIARLATQRAAEREQAQFAACTADGHAVEVVANIRNAEDAAQAMAAGADGVGLLRSEFLFENRDTAPSESEQAAEYGAVARALGPQRVLVVRTLDVGGDKPLAYMPLPKEDNPFLGLRGIRVSLAAPDFFRAQIRAIGKAAGLAKLHVMFPMIASIEEFRQAKQILLAELPAGADVKVGVMIEVPSAALLADQLAREVDFFSIGTNDLTQYTLAMDRGHPQLARQADALHPAVLKMIEMTVEGAHRHGRWVGVCGGMASDVMAVPALIGLGVDELSASIPAIAQVKALVSRLNYAECKILAKQLLQQGTAAEVRALLAPLVEEG